MGLKIQNFVTNVKDGVVTGNTAGTNVLSPKSGKRMTITSFVMQIYGVTSAGVVELVGEDGTKVSGQFYVDSDGLNVVKDAVRINLDTDEQLRLVNGTDGNVRWIVYLEELASVDAG